eukprot:TRINITY_DN83924_c0_g1_i1.p1 TRINITY_DN83924_c0_g1~~TRINITY_DN83924_c0_g1_i1.p1  ORF type:complete len:188 (+),score=15.02 TRINITY_DN83924_c0_g1_i1:73-564(+)
MSRSINVEPDVDQWGKDTWRIHVNGRERTGSTHFVFRTASHARPATFTSDELRQMPEVDPWGLLWTSTRSKDWDKRPEWHVEVTPVSPSVRRKRGFDVPRPARSCTPRSTLAQSAALSWSQPFTARGRYSPPCLTASPMHIGNEEQVRGKYGQRPFLQRELEG